VLGAWRQPRLLLVFDTETGVDAAQALLFGCARVYRWDAEGFALIKEVLFYADELEEVDQFGYGVLRSYATCEGLLLLSRREFVKKILWRVGHKGRAWIVGFNLPFDLSRLAVAWSTTRTQDAGGFSLTIWDYPSEERLWLENRYRPRVQIKTIDSKRALITFTKRRDPDELDLIPEDADGGEPVPGYKFPGHFLDLRTLAFALTNKGHSLASACEAFHVEHPKTKPARHGVIDDPYIDYCRRDVLASAELCERMLADYERHPIGLPPTRARSPAAIAKAYLNAMGITSPLEQNPDFPRDRLGQAMSAYYGGRAECRIRRQPMPVVLVDFLSMYTTVQSLMGLSRFLIAERIEIVDATKEVRRFLEQTTLDDCFRPETWAQLPTLCLVQPNGEILPSRAGYDAAGLQIGVNPLTGRKPLWYPLPDLLAATLLGGRIPTVIEAWRLVPISVQNGLRPVHLRGEVEIDPCKDDIFRRVIEERKRLDRRDDLDPVERTRLGETLKVIANSGSYGITAEITRHELGSRRQNVTVWSLDEPFTERLSVVEDAGRFCFPPLAAIVTAGARLMLALLEHCVSNEDGSYVFCDTDSLAIVATRQGGELIACQNGDHLLSDGRAAVRALSLDAVDRIAERFRALSLYDPRAIPGSILKVEKINFDEDGQWRQLYTYAISAKRYCLYVLDEQQRPQIVKASEHGLGHLLNPTDPDSDDRDWIPEAWRLLVCRALGLPVDEPEWLDRPALAKLAITTPATLAPFENYNRDRPAREQIRPSNFLLAAQVAPLGHPTAADPQRFRLIAPYEADPGLWEEVPWFNLYDGAEWRVAFDGDPSPHVIRVKTYRDVLGLYATHPEPKSLGADGKPCGRSTRGLLSRRPVTMSTLTLIGKESNKLEERSRGLIGDINDTLSTYGADRHGWSELVLPALADLPTKPLAERTRLDPRTIQRIRAATSTPRQQHRTVLTLVASDLVGDVLAQFGFVVPDDPVARLALYVDNRQLFTQRTCASCGATLGNGPACYCSPACKKRAYRDRRRHQPHLA
jgi:hypothetical protein